jgi:hypothetical protein
MADSQVQIPLTLRGQHLSVRVTQNAVSRAARREDGRLDVGRREGIVHIVVSREQVRSALLLLHAVFGEAERRGYSVVPTKHESYGPPAGVAIEVRGHRYAVEVTELTDQAALTAEDVEEWQRQEAKRFRFSFDPEPQPPKWKHVPNGYLRLSLPQRGDGGRSNWSAGPRGGLESKLPSFFVELERRAGEDDRRDEERQRREAEWRRQELDRQERQRQSQIEDARAKRLLEEIAPWRRAKDVDEYVAALRSRLPDLEPADRERIASWCDWAEDWARRRDPLQRLQQVRGLLENEPPAWAPWRGE